MWELITGKKLFLGANDLETVKAVRNHEIPDIRELDRRVDEQLAAIINQALSKDPNGRFQSYEEFSQALIKYLFARGTPVTNFSHTAYQRIVDRSSVSRNSESARRRFKRRAHWKIRTSKPQHFNPEQASKAVKNQAVSKQAIRDPAMASPQNKTPHKQTYRHQQLILKAGEQIHLCHSTYRPIP